MNKSKKNQSRAEWELGFWTAAPIKYGLPALIAALIVSNVLVVKVYLFDGKPYESSAVFLLLSVLIAGGFVHRKVQNLKSNMKDRD